MIKIKVSFNCKLSRSQKVLTGPDNKNSSRQQVITRTHSNNDSLCKHFIELMKHLFLTVLFLSTSCQTFCL